MESGRRPSAFSAASTASASACAWRSLAGGGEDEVVGHRRQALEVQDDELLGLLVEERRHALLELRRETLVELGVGWRGPRGALDRRAAPARASVASMRSSTAPIGGTGMLHGRRYRPCFRRYAATFAGKTSVQVFSRGDGAP